MFSCILADLGNSMSFHNTHFEYMSAQIMSHIHLLDCCFYQGDKNAFSILFYCQNLELLIAGPGGGGGQTVDTNK